MEAYIPNILEKISDKSDIKEIRRVFGGDINLSFFTRTNEEAYFIKLQPGKGKDFFHPEVVGLKTLQATNTVHVPNVFGYGEINNISYLVLKWIDGRKQSHTEILLGESLANLHHTFGNAHGFQEDNWIGKLPQRNGIHSSWLEFFRNERLDVQFSLASKLGRLPESLNKDAIKLLDRLDRWIPEEVPPSLLHGDLWSGNWIPGPEGIPYFIDPAVYYGHREVDIAFSELFGGFSNQFYEAYHYGYPIDPEYKERKPLYQLYYLLVHLNLFGRSYLSSVDQVVKRYVK